MEWKTPGDNNAGSPAIYVSLRHRESAIKRNAITSASCTSVRLTMRRRPSALNEPLESDTLAYRSPTTEEAGRMKLARLFAHYPKGEPVLLYMRKCVAWARAEM